MYFKRIYYETKYLIQELFLLIKHPTRKATYLDIKYHWLKLWDELLFDHIYSFKIGCKNLISWFPVIWSTRNWDYTYLLLVMDKQMESMEKFFLSDKTVTLHAKQRGKRIKWCRKLQNMWYDEYYTMNEYEKHKAKFPNEPSMFDHDEEDITRDEYGVPVLYRCKPHSLECSNDFRVHSEIGRAKDEKVFKLWVKNLSKIKDWWD